MPLQVSYLLVSYLFYMWCKYDITDTFMTLMPHNILANIAPLGRGLEQSLIDDAVDQWPILLRAYIPANGGHFEHISCLWICFLCTWWTLFHTTLDAVGNILRVDYKSMKCDVSFSLGSEGTLFRWGEHVFHLCVKMFFLLTAVQNYNKSSAAA